MEFQDFFNNLLMSNTNSVGILDLLITFVLPYILTIPIVYFYRYFNKGSNYDLNFIHSLLLFSSITSVTTLMIGSSIARAFGLVAALSIIRFRTALKSPLDSMYMFWALSIGMATGTGYYIAAFMIVFIGILLQYLTITFKIGEITKSQYIFKIELKNTKNAYKSVEKKLKDKKFSFQKVNVFSSDDHSRTNHIYSVSVPHKANLADVVSEIQEIDSVLNLKTVNSDAALFV